MTHLGSNPWQLAKASPQSGHQSSRFHQVSDAYSSEDPEPCTDVGQRRCIRCFGIGQGIYLNEKMGQGGNHYFSIADERKQD